ASPDASGAPGLARFLARPGRGQNIDAARALLDAMVEDGVPDGLPGRLEAARLAGVLPPGFGRAIGRLLRDADVEVARQAMRSVSLRPRPEFLPELLAGLGHPELADDAARALASLGDVVVDALGDHLDGGSTSL